MQSAGRLVLHENRRSASIGPDAVDLSGREWTLLSLLVQHQGKVVSKEQIQKAWSGSDASEVGSGNSIEVYMHRLRRKLEGSGVSIRTVRGIGYLMQTEGHG